MRRASAVAAAALALSLATLAIAGDAALDGERGDATTGPLPSLPAPTGDARDGVRAGLAAQLAVAHKTGATVAGKRADATAARAARVRAAYQVLRPRTELGGTVDGWLASARRRAASRYLLARAQREERLLADETTRLAAATARVTAEFDAALALAAPTTTVTGLRWPVDGPVTIAAGPGAWVHAASGATLARRGVELTVASHATALAPGAGTVRYAGPIRGLGLGVIIDHGGAWTVVARLGALVVRRGEQVAARAPLGTAAARALAVEVRLPLGPGGTPVAPASFLTR